MCLSVCGWLKPQRHQPSRPSPTQAQPAPAGFAAVAANSFARQATLSRLVLPTSVSFGFTPLEIIQQRLSRMMLSLARDVIAHGRRRAFG